MAVYSSFTDQQLIALLKEGDQSAFEELYKSYPARILKRLIRLVKDEEIAKEMLQDIFLKVWEKREHLDPEKSFRSYLFRIAENLVTDFFRKAAHDRKMLEHLIQVSTELYNTTEETLNLVESNAALKEAIDALPEQRRKIFILCKIEGKSYDEVALMLGVSKGTINDHMVKAMRSVRKHFSADGLAFTCLIALALKSF